MTLDVLFLGLEYVNWDGFDLVEFCYSVGHIELEDFCCHQLSKSGYDHTGICSCEISTHQGEYFSTIFGLLLYLFELSM